jgi:hypothetical protein
MSGDPNERIGSLVWSQKKMFAVYTFQRSMEELVVSVKQ